MLPSSLRAQDLHITLLNGDCDGDNEVTLLDFGIVVNAFASTPNDPNWIWGGSPTGLYIIGSLDDKDWSVGGRQDHW